MKKRTAILLCAVLISSIGGYVAWCFRPFYLKARLDFVGNVSPGGRRAAEEWRKSDAYPELLGFSRDKAWWNLRHPWDCRMGLSVAIMENPERGLWATDFGRLWGFSKTGGEWDASTVMPYANYSDALSLQRVNRQGKIASRIDAMGANGATIDILSLGRLTYVGLLERQAGEAPDSDPSFPNASITMKFLAGPRLRTFANGSSYWIVSPARSVKPMSMRNSRAGASALVMGSFSRWVTSERST